MGGHVFGAFDGDRMVGFCFAIPGVKPGGRPYLHSHMLGVLPEYRNARHRAAAEAARSARTRCARHRADRVDLRSAGAEERLLQYRAAGRDCAALHARISTASPPARCTAACRRTAASPNGGSIRRACAAMLAGEPLAHRRGRGADRRTRPISRASAREDPERAREIQQANAASSSSDAFARGLAVIGFERTRREGHVSAGAMRMKLERVTLRQIRMPLVHFFETSFGRTYERDIILVEVAGRRRFGLGRSHRGRESFLQRGVDRLGLADPARLRRRRACSARELRKRRRRGAADRAHPRPQHGARRPGSRGLGPGGAPATACRCGSRSAAARGARSPAASRSAFRIRWSSCSRRSRRELAAGYQRIKMKIKPGWDVDVVRQVRERFPAIKLMADANSAYTLADTDHLKQLDEFYLMMIEQPLAHDDIIDHAALQAQLADADLPRRMHPHRASRRAGDPAAGLRHHQYQAGPRGRIRAKRRRVHDVAQAAGIPVWCGGMLEAGIGRAHNIALATLPNFVLPGDVSASKRYWKRDIIQPGGGDHAARHDRDPRRARASATSSTTTSSAASRSREGTSSRSGLNAFRLAAARQPQLPQHVDRPGGQRGRRPLQQHRRLQPGAGAPPNRAWW